MTTTFARLFTLAITASLTFCIPANAEASARETDRADAVAVRAAAGGDAGAASEAARHNRIANRGTTEASRAANFDKHEDHQQKRIDQGIKKGQLTPDEVTSLKSQEKNIQALEDSFKSDGKLTKKEAKQLGATLKNASLQIWAQRHDTEGNQKPVSRLGKDIFAQDNLTAKIESGDIARAQARAFLADFHKMTTIKRRLGADNVSDEQRAKLQAEFNDLLNTYFLTR